MVNYVSKTILFVVFVIIIVSLLVRPSSKIRPLAGFHVSAGNDVGKYHKVHSDLHVEADVI